MSQSEQEVKEAAEIVRSVLPQTIAENKAERRRLEAEVPHSREKHSSQHLLHYTKAISLMFFTLTIADLRSQRSVASRQG
jgi:hypothetical protein